MSVCVYYLYGDYNTAVRNIYESEILCIYAAFVYYVPMKKYIIRSSWPNKIVANPEEEEEEEEGVARNRRWRGVLFSIIGSVSCARFLLVPICV